jgi:hypothetical protein
MITICPSRSTFVAVGLVGITVTSVVSVHEVIYLSYVTLAPVALMVAEEIRMPLFEP